MHVQPKPERPFAERAEIFRRIALREATCVSIAKEMGLSPTRVNQLYHHFRKEMVSMLEIDRNAGGYRATGTRYYQDEDDNGNPITYRLIWERHIGALVNTALQDGG